MDALAILTKIWGAAKRLFKLAQNKKSVVSGRHEAHGVGAVTALEVAGQTEISKKTISKASGVGKITAT